MSDAVWASASDNPWLDDAVEALQSASVYVDPAVGGRDDLLDTLQQEVPADGSIAVVVLPSSAGDGQLGSTYLVDTLLSGSDYDTVLLAVGRDFSAASTVIDDTEEDVALRIANETEPSTSGDLAPALTESIQRLEDAVPAGSGSSSGGGLGGIVLPVVIGAVVVVAAAGTIFGIVTGRRRRGAAGSGVPGVIRERLDRLRALRNLYQGRGMAGDRVAGQVSTDIGVLVDNTAQLFQRLDAKAGPAQRSEAEGEYADKLARLVAALEQDYLLDLLANPHLWDDPDQRIGEVREALGAVSTQIVENIKQVNARRALHFQVSLDSLVGREELRDWEREFNRGSS